MINKKVKKAFEAGLTPILCCGEIFRAERNGHYLRLDPYADQI